MLSTVRLSDFGLFREPPRPAEDRQPGYEAMFDYDTLFFDVFRSFDGRKIICLGPPLLNCESFFAAVRFRLNGGTRALQTAYRPSQHHLQPSCRYELTIPDAADPIDLTIEAGGKAATVPVRASLCSTFKGRRVAVTMIKDTPIEWIRDWAQFNIRIHGAESIVLYNNGSSIYAEGELQATLDELDAPGPNLVVDWDFPYGPGVGPSNTQDSFYCQPGGLDHARRRCLTLARSVLNCDVDELVVGPEGLSVFDEAEQGSGPGLHIPGRWVELVHRPEQEKDTREMIRHRDFLLAQRKQTVWRVLGVRAKLLRSKWVALPANCDDRVDWTVHSLMSADKRDRGSQMSKQSRRFMYRHFRQLTTRKVNPRQRIKGYNPIKYEFDRDLHVAMQKAWDSDLEKPDSHPEFS